MSEVNDNHLPFNKRKLLILSIDSLVSHSISLTNTCALKLKHAMSNDVPVGLNANEKWQKKRTIKDKDMFNMKLHSLHKVHTKSANSVKSAEDELLSQRKENIKGYLNHIIRFKQNNKLKLIDIEDKIIHNKFDVDVSKNKMFNMNMKWNSSNSAVNRNNKILGNSLLKRKLNIVSKTIDLDNHNNVFNHNDVVNTSSLNSYEAVQSSDLVSISSSSNNNNKQQNITTINNNNNNTRCLLDKCYFNNNNKHVAAPFNLLPLNTINNSSNNQRHVLLNVKLLNKPKTFEQNIISDTNNNNTSKNIITTENLISLSTLTKIRNNNYIQTPEYKNASSLLIKKTLERSYLLTQLNESLFRVLKDSSSHRVYDSLSEEEIDSIETKHLYLIFPDCVFIQLWQYLLSLLSLVAIFILPIDLAFINNMNTYTLILNCITPTILFIDVLLHFFVPYVPNIEHEIYETKKPQIALHYIKGWFIYDVLTSLPINAFHELLYHYNINTSHHHSLFELFKLLPLLKPLKLIFSTNYPSINSHTSSLSFIMNSLSKQGRMIVFFVLFLLLNHVLACVFAFIGKLSYPNWLTHTKSHNKSSVDIYIAGMYYNITTIFTCGFGDIISITFKEKVYTMLLQSIGIFLYSYMVSSMMNIIKKDESELKLERKLYTLEQINMDYKLNKSLYTKLQRVLKYDYVVNKEEKIKFIKEFPDHIKNVLIYAMFSDVVKFKFFKNTNFDFVSKVILNMKPVRFALGDVLVKRKCYFEEMFFVERGTLSLERNYLNKIIKIAEIMRGEHFGEVNMLLNKKSKFDLVVKSKTCECFLLNKDTLIEIVEKYQDIFSRKEKKATMNYYLFEKKLRRRKREIDKDELFTSTNDNDNKHMSLCSVVTNSANKTQLLKTFTKKYLNEPYEQHTINERDDENESEMSYNYKRNNCDVNNNNNNTNAVIDDNNISNENRTCVINNNKSIKGLSPYKIKIDKVAFETKTPKRNLSYLNAIQPLSSNIVSPKMQRNSVLSDTPQQYNLSLNVGGDNDNDIINNIKRRHSHFIEKNNTNKDFNSSYNQNKFSTGVIGLNIKKPLSSRALTDKVKQGAIVMKQTIHEGSMNMSQPKMFYSNLFDRLKLSDQLHKISSIYTLLKNNT